MYSHDILKITGNAALNLSTNGTINISTLYDTVFNNNNVTLTELMRIKGSGNVGIGTSAPTQKLHVKGNIQAEMTSNVNTNITSFGPDTHNINQVNAHTYIGRYGGSEFSGMRCIITNDTSQNINLNPNHAHLDFYTWGFGVGNFSSKMRIWSHGTVGIGESLLTPPAYKLYVNGTVGAASFTQTSDDRIKSDEIFITDATLTLNKLRPQIYNKWNSMEYTTDSNATSNKESGIIAQEVFYDAPELRHLLTLPIDANSNTIYSTNMTSSADPAIDPSYTGWGSNIAGVNYIGLIPYLIKAIQEKDIEIKDMNARLTAAGL
jgi:hypothetical protein